MFENPRWRRPPCWKSQKSRYLRNGLTDFYEIWYGCFKKVLLTSQIIKNWISKIQDGEQLPFWKPLNHHISAYNRHDEIIVCVVSGVVVWIGQLLLTCSDFKFSVNDSLELSGIQFTPPKRTRQRQESFVVSDMAVWIDCFSLTRFEQRQWPRNGSIRSVRPRKKWTNYIGRWSRRVEGTAAAGWGIRHPSAPLWHGGSTQ